MKHDFVESIFNIKDDVFFDNIWEEKPFYYKNDISKNSATDFFTTGDLEELLHGRTLTTQQLRLSSTNSNIPAEAYSEADGRINTEKLFYYFSLGSTIVVKNLEFHFPKVRQKLDSFGTGQRLLKRAFVNLYFTPASSQGFITHYDNQDVVIVQIAGRKKWSLYEPSNTNPVEDYKVSIHNTEKLLNEYMLEPGDALYMPRGVYHHAATSGEMSCHLTFSFVPVTYADVLRKVSEQKVIENPSLRKSLSPASKPLNITITEAEIQRALKELSPIPANGRGTTFENYFSLDFPELQATHTIKRAGIDFSVHKDGSFIVCKRNGLPYKFPAEAESIIMTVKDLKTNMLIAAIPTELDDESTCFVLQKLLYFRMIELA